MNVGYVLLCATILVLQDGAIALNLRASLGLADGSLAVPDQDPRSAGVLLKLSNGTVSCPAGCSGSPKDIVDLFWTPTPRMNYGVCEMRHTRQVVVPSYFASHQFYDEGAAGRCLQNKKLLFLGDSTLRERFHDLILLLASKKNRNSRAQAYYNRVIKARSGANQLDGGNIAGSFDADDSPTHHDRSAKMKEKAHNISLDYFWGAHPSVSDNAYGLPTLLDQEVRHKLGELYGFAGGSGTLPDIVIIGSGVHDAWRINRKENGLNITLRGQPVPPYGFDSFERTLVSVKSDLLEWSQKGVKVVWVSNVNYHDKDFSRLDSIAQRVLLKTGVEFVDFQDILAWSLYDPTAGETPPPVGKSGHYAHYCWNLFHVGANGREKNPDHSLLMSSLLLQRLMNSICPQRGAP